MSNDKATVRTILDEMRGGGRTALDPAESKRVCEAYGIPTPKEAVVASAAEAAQAAEKIGFPVMRA